MGRISEVDVCLPCPSDSARRRHLAKGEVCDWCGVPDEPLATVTAIRTGLDDSIRRHPAGRAR